MIFWVGVLMIRRYPTILHGHSHCGSGVISDFLRPLDQRVIQLYG